VSFATTDLDYVAWMLIIVILTAATGVVMVPLALLLHHLVIRSNAVHQ
jgi:hypothetical protein